MNLTELQKVCHNESVARGWWADSRNPYVLATKIALIHSEISEALEYLRQGGQDKHLPHRLGIEVELADAIIRICDLAGALGLDLDGAIIEKLIYNKRRYDHDPAMRAAPGGKEF